MLYYQANSDTDGHEDVRLIRYYISAGFAVNGAGRTEAIIKTKTWTKPSHNACKFTLLFAELSEETKNAVTSETKPTKSAYNLDVNLA